MKSTLRVVYPVEKLRTEVSALEAAVAVVVARPKKKAVHELRKTTRKIQAHLEVIRELSSQEPGFGAVAKPAKQVKKLLGALRKAAGRVRDLDVQRAMVKSAVATGATKTVWRQGKDLRRELGTERQAEARALVSELTEHALDLETKLEKMLAALAPVSGVGMVPTDLEALAQGWYERRKRKAQAHRKPVEGMHDLRKAAKLARYMTGDGLSAAQFEALQEAGGSWHDALTLRDVAWAKLGKKSELAGVFAEREEAARAEFERKLEEN